MVLVTIRTAIIFIVLLIIMRLMGKRQIGEMQPFELVITLLIAELACIPMADVSIPLLYGIISVVTIFVLHEIMTLLDLKLKPLKSFISGKPSVVVNKNGIDDYQLKRNNLDVSDLIESLRTAGYFSLDAVDYALYEANGTFSALPNQNYEQMQTSLPLVIIDNGKYDQKNLKITGLKQSYFDEILKEQNIKSPKEVLVLTADGTGKIYLQVKNASFPPSTWNIRRGKYGKVPYGNFRVACAPFGRGALRMVLRGGSVFLLRGRGEYRGRESHAGLMGQTQRPPSYLDPA